MDILSNYQKKLFPYAYNILGSADDAMDAIQDVIVNYVSNPKQGIENETGYLIKGVINQSINIKKRNKRHAGDVLRLPEPVATEKADQGIHRNEIISYSMLVLLEHLNPKERAVFILKEAFDYSHEEIADTLALSVEHSRKLLSRAKHELKNTDAHFRTASPGATGFLESYIHAIKNGDTKGLEELLANDIAVKTDGGKIKIVNELVVGLKPATDLMLYVYDTYQKLFSVEISSVNHQPALLFYKDNTLVNCQIFELENGKIKGIFSIVDPEKLKNI